MTMAVSRLSKLDHRPLLLFFLHLSPPVDRWCGAIGFVCSQVVSRTPQHFDIIIIIIIIIIISEEEQEDEEEQEKQEEQEQEQEE